MGAKRPILCYVTDRRSLPGLEQPGSSAISALLQSVEAALQAGVDWVQIREKDLPASALTLLTREAVRLAAECPAGDKRVPKILINDRLDIAIAEGADGVHLSEQSLDVAEVRRTTDRWAAQGTIQREFVVGASCHSLEAAEEAERNGADYIIFGPIFATPSKRAYGEPQGLERLREVCKRVAIPVLAIGGVTVRNAEKCLEAGAAGVAAIRMFQDSSDLSSVVSQLRRLGN
jgi:thiamine-phosphate pyrophosphorylase